MDKRNVALCGIVVSGALLAACTSNEATSVETSTQPSPSATTTTRTPKPAASATTAVAQNTSINCSGYVDNERQEIAFASLEEAWAYSGETPLEDCYPDAFAATQFLTRDEIAAVSATGEFASSKEIASLYGTCAETSDYYAIPGTSLSESQIEEAGKYLVGMDALCPNAPQIATIQANIDESNSKNASISAGEIIYSGTYIVGQTVQPGTYVIQESGDACYWERLDSSGNIIANNFIQATTRVEVTIQPTDYSFNSDGCGEWVRQ